MYFGKVSMKIVQPSLTCESKKNALLINVIKLATFFCVTVMPPRFGAEN